MAQRITERLAGQERVKGRRGSPLRCKCQPCYPTRLLVAGILTTKRYFRNSEHVVAELTENFRGEVSNFKDIYYRDPELFVKQAIVDRYIDDVAYTLDVSRQELNVVAAAKGLINGCFGILKKDGQTVDYSADDNRIHTSDISQIKDIFFRRRKWVLARN